MVTFSSPSVRARISVRNLARFLIVAMLMVTALGYVPAAAVNQPPLIDAEQTATIDFPLTIDFRLVAEAPEPVSRAELRYTIAGKEYSNAAVVSFEETTAVDASYTVDAQVDYIEPGVDVVFHWVLGPSDDPIAQTAEQTITWVDESFGWQRYDSEDVRLYTYGNDEEFDRYILQVAQESADKYKLAYDVPEIEPMRIWVYTSAADFARTLRQNSESWIGGFSLPEAGVIAIPIEPGDVYTVERVVSHEVSHHVLYQATKNPFTYAPTWLDEGLAVTGQLAGNTSDLQLVLGAFEEGTLPTLRTLTSSFPTDPAAANRSYATSHVVVGYIIDTWGTDAITGLIRQFRASSTADQALLAVLGTDTEGLDTQFRDWLGQQASTAGVLH